MVVDQEVTIYDFDGTLFQLPVDYAAVRRDLGLPPEAKIGQLLQRFLDEGDETGLAVVTRHEHAAVANGSLTPGARDCLRAPGRAAIVTRNSREVVLTALGELVSGLPVVGREDVRRLKPDPEGIHLVLARLGADPASATMVGDTYHDVEAARAAGVRSVVVRNPLLAYAPSGADTYLDVLSPTLLRGTTHG